MAGYDNIKNKGFDHRTTEELREIQSRGGRNSGKARRRKADFRKTLNMLLTAEIDSPEWTPILQSLGLDSTLEAAVNMAMVKKALAGDVKAYEAIAKYAGQSDRTENDDAEQAAKTEREKAQAEMLKDKQSKEKDTENSVIQNMETLADVLKRSRPNRNIEDYEEE